MTPSTGYVPGGWPPQVGGRTRPVPPLPMGLLGAGLALGAAAAWSGLELRRYLGRKAAQDTASPQGYGYTESL